MSYEYRPYGVSAAGSSRCPRCSGYGTLKATCAVCRGSGKDWGTERCGRCYGDGKEEVRCTSCNGTGYC